MAALSDSEAFPGPAIARKLTEAQARKLHAACLEILERTGVRVYEPEGVELLRKAGAGVEDGNRVRIPPKLVERALTTAPRTLTIHDRSGRPAFHLGAGETYFGTGSECLSLIDHRTGERRKPDYKDLLEAVKVAEGLKNVDFVMSMVTPQEIDPKVVNQYQMEAMLTGSSKPIVYIGAELESCLDATEMAEAAAGGAEELLRRPQVICYINVTTGLKHNRESVQRLLYLAGKGLPLTYVPSSQGGTTAPVPLAASMAVAQAGALAGLVMSQLKREGAPFITTGWSGNMLDMRTTIQPYCDPEKRGGAIELGRYLGLPTFALAGCTDSKVVDQQAALEAALTLATDLLFGADLVHDLGYMESGQSYSLVQLAVCDEILSWLKAFHQGIEITDETLCLDLIDALGPDGQYINQRHTFDNFRSRWYPSLLDRANRRRWLEEGGRDLGQRARERVEEILAGPRAEPLDRTRAQAIRAVVARAEARPG